MCIFSGQDPVRNAANFIACSLYVLLQDPDNICDKTVSDPGFLERSPSRIDKDPDFSWSFHVGLRILPVTEREKLMPSEAKCYFQTNAEY
jgi:hypothetical protein